MVVTVYFKIFQNYIPLEKMNDLFKVLKKIYTKKNNGQQKLPCLTSTAFFFGAGDAARSFRRFVGVGVVAMAEWSSKR